MTQSDSKKAGPDSGITEATTPISKLKSPMPLSFVKGAWNKFSQAHLMTGGDESIYYATHFSNYVRTAVAMPPLEKSVIGRNLQPKIDGVKFTARDGSQTMPLKEYLHEGGPRRVQAMMMAHKGKVVFEAYPGMNPTDMHMWMSASKTTTSLLTNLLEQEGLFSYDDPVVKHVPELAGSVWDDISFRDSANMAAGLDIEETFVAESDPKSWISLWFAALLGGKGDQWIQIMRNAKKIPGEAPGSHMRYSTPNPMILVLAVQNITQKSWIDVFNQRVWSKIGANGPLIIALTPDGVPIGGGFLNSAPEDLLRYAMLYTPSWNVVSQERVVSEKVLERTRTLGDPAAFVGCEEESWSLDFFGEKAERNSCQWDHVFADGAMFKHGSMGQGIYADPGRDFCGMTFALSSNFAGPDHSPGYLRAAAKMLAGK